MAKFKAPGRESESPPWLHESAQIAKPASRHNKRLYSYAHILQREGDRPSLSGAIPVQNSAEQHAHLRTLYDSIFKQLLYFRRTLLRMILAHASVLSVLVFAFSQRPTHAAVDPLVYQGAAYTLIVVTTGVFYAVVLIMNGYIQATARVIHLAEVAMGAYERGRFVEDAILFPEAWGRFGSDRWTESYVIVGHIFLPASTLLAFAAVYLVALGPH